jgi:hypothetical protein
LATAFWTVSSAQATSSWIVNEPFAGLRTEAKAPAASAWRPPRRKARELASVAVPLAGA